jgi:hypothetical protein
VLEPSCGIGNFLKAIPDDVPAIGVELDAALVEQCRLNTTREILHGDFRTVDLPAGITQVIGNPPFSVTLINALLRRAHNVLPSGGRCGLLLPAYAMQTHNTVGKWMNDWSIKAETIPRTLFPSIKLPLIFSVFTRDKRRNLLGMALYSESLEFDNLCDRAKEVLIKGAARRGVWRALVEDVLGALGGRASLAAIYEAIEPKRPTPNAFWREKVRQQLQLHCTSIGGGVWEIKACQN